MAANDVITKNNSKIKTSVKPNKLYIIQKLAIYWIWATLSKVILACFTMPTYQIYIWSFYVTQGANFGNFKLWPNYALTLRKCHQISGGKVFYLRSYQPKTSRGRGGGGGAVPLGWKFHFKRQCLRSDRCSILNYTIILLIMFHSNLVTYI